jgi:peptidoglycan LD-endopeptidase CwlK
VPSFSLASKAHLNSCHKDLQMLFNTVIFSFDCSILCGRRGDLEQNQAFVDGRSKLKYPDSKHNKTPSMAVDAAPYPVDWHDPDRMNYFSGYVMGIAALLYYEGFMSHRVRWGGDWNRNTILKDNNFNDLVHFELMGV